MNRTLLPGASAVALSVALIVLFVVCAFAQLVAPGLQAAHAWVGLFTVAPVNSIEAWVEGLAFSLVFGLIAGFVFALTYNTMAAKGR